MVKGGSDKTEAALAVFKKKSVQSIESSPEYLTIVATASKIEREELRQEIEAIKRKQIRTYSDLLDQGNEIIKSADSIEEKIAAQANQRANLSTGVVENAVSWMGEDRNKNDLGDILEGVIL